MPFNGAYPKCICSPKLKDNVIWKRLQCETDHCLKKELQINRKIEKTELRSTKNKDDCTLTCHDIQKPHTNKQYLVITFKLSKIMTGNRGS